MKKVAGATKVKGAKAVPVDKLIVPPMAHELAIKFVGIGNGMGCAMKVNIDGQCIDEDLTYVRELNDKYGAFLPVELKFGLAALDILRNIFENPPAHLIDKMRFVLPKEEPVTPESTDSLDDNSDAGSIVTGDEDESQTE